MSQTQRLRAMYTKTHHVAHRDPPPQRTLPLIPNPGAIYRAIGPQQGPVDTEDSPVSRMLCQIRAVLTCSSGRPVKVVSFRGTRETRFVGEIGAGTWRKGR